MQKGPTSQQKSWALSATTSSTNNNRIVPEVAVMTTIRSNPGPVAEGANVDLPNTPSEETSSNPFVRLWLGYEAFMGTLGEAI